MAKNADEPTIWGAVAQPRRPVNTGTYMGDELAHRSSRAGAYDAMKLPSLFSGRRHIPGEQAPSSAAPRYLPPPPAAAPVPPPPPAVLKVSPKESDMSYTPREGSVPARVIGALKSLRPDDFFTSEQIARECGVLTSSIPAHLHTPISRGALVRVNVHGKAGFALPGFRAPEVLPPAPPAQAPQQLGRREPQSSPVSTSAPALDDDSKERIAASAIAEDSAAGLIVVPNPALRRARADFAAALWSDGVLELHGVSVPADGCGHLRLTADQVKQIARLLGGLTLA